ncbi:MAG TPA: acyl-CoA dehydrogenase [Nitrospiria bacterium]|nr:acyl-CoA dehydrogenase [Nitrospiria bacterium]
MLVAGIILWLLALWWLATVRAPAIIWTVALAVPLAVCPAARGADPSHLALWAVYLLVTLPFNFPPLRRLLISGPLLRLFRRLMPPMSDTEREALNAGTVWWDGQLFSGRPDWRALFATPAPSFSAEEQAFLDGPVEELCRLLDDWRINEVWRDLPPEVWRFMKEKGFFGMIIPRHYGGLEFSALAHSSVVMKIASRSITGAVTVMVPNSLGPAELLLHYGTEEQKRHYLPRLARGEEVPCFALTSLDAGSDAASMTDTGVVCRGEFDGRRNVLGIRLNWSKRYITLSPVATVLGLAFKLLDPDHLLGDREEIGITVALIPTSTPGVEIGRRHAPLHNYFQNGPTSGRDVFIPVDWIVGGPARAGQGWRMLVECLAAGRSISLPALAAGAGKVASRATGAYARVRKQFKVPIGRFEGIQEALARIGGLAYLMDAARVMTVGALDRGEKPSVISAIVKYHLTELMRRAVDDAMDVHGGRGIIMGPRNYLARVYEAVPISITVEGANILTRNLIIFGQGAIRCHPYLLKEIEAAGMDDPARAASAFDRAFFAHVSFGLSNAARALWYGLTGARFSPAPPDQPLRRYCQQLTRASTALALASDVAMVTLGGSLKRREALSARLGDVLSYLYLASATVKRFADQARPADDLPLVHWGCWYSLHLIQQRLDELMINLPSRTAAWLLRRLIFPLGRPFRPPEDRVVERVAALLMETGPVRDRLSAGIYLPNDPTDRLGRLESALTAVMAAEPVEKTLRAALHERRLPALEGSALLDEAVRRGVISEIEAKSVREAEERRREALRVDDFGPEEWAALR